MKNDLLPTCDFQISLTINCELTWPGLSMNTTIFFKNAKPILWLDFYGTGPEGIKQVHSIADI